MSKLKPFYITTTLPYANGMPHIGHTVEFVRADILARFKRLQGHEVFLNTGIDEHGKKNLEKAQELGITPQEYVDGMAVKWQEFCKSLEMEYDFFSRTTAEHHERTVQKFWELCTQKGYIYKAQYTAKYCVGCEMEKTDSELDDSGECPDHKGKALEQIDEENYFFKYSAFEDNLLALYAQEPGFIVPDFRRNEVRSFVQSGLRDFSISRLKSKMSWGVPVPGDSDHVIYVWFDALPNYISCLKWGSDNGDFNKFWNGGTTVQFCGKDNLRPQTAMWQAMLMAAGIKNTDIVSVGGHILSGGQKMSKTVGNTVDPFEYIERYGVEAVRYFLARHIHPVQDSDFTAERFNELYTADLVNGLGNLVARVMKMAETHLDAPVSCHQRTPGDIELDQEYVEAFDKLDFSKVADIVWGWIGEVDELITSEEPFKVVKVDKDKAQKMIESYVQKLHKIAVHLQPIMPITAKIILEAVLENKKPENMFGRIELESVSVVNDVVREDIKYSIEQKLEGDGIKVALAVCNVPSNSKRRSSELKEHIDTRLASLNIQELRQSPIVTVYEDFYSKVGLEAQPAASHLLDLVEQSGGLPNINRIVDIYNTSSVASQVSFGAHDMQGINGDIVFKYTDGSEQYMPLGGKSTRVNPGEYACMDDGKILCRMDIKQCEETKVTGDTKSFVLYAQGNRETTQEYVDNALKEACGGIEKFVGGECEMIY